MLSESAARRQLPIADRASTNRSVGLLSSYHASLVIMPVMVLSAEALSVSYLKKSNH